MANKEIKVARSQEEIEARIKELTEIWLIFSDPCNATQCARECACTSRAIGELAWVLGQEEPD